MFWWRHFETSSLLLFSVIFLSAVMIFNVSAEHNWHFFWFCWCTLELSHRFPIQYCMFHHSSSDSIMCFDKSVLCSYSWCRKDVWWLEYCCLKACSVNAIYSSFSWSLVTTALYTVDFSWHLPFIGQLDLTRQLHFQSWGVDASTVLLWLLMILATFGIQLLLTSMVLRLKILLTFDCFPD